MQKVQKEESVNIQSDWETKRKKRIDLSCVFTHSGKVWKGGSVNTQNDFETASKKWADRKKRMICKWLNSKKTSSRSFKRISRK